MPGTWDPQIYDRFEAERRQPFDDLLALVTPCPAGLVADLGCGTGALTVDLHRHTRAAETVGIDSSAAMLDRVPSVDGVRFTQGDIDEFAADDLDVVFSNAALHWVPDHRALLPRLVACLGPGGQLAFQVPANSDHPAYRLANGMATEEPYSSAFGGSPPADRGETILPPEDYARVLDALGAVELHVRLQVYGHHLEAAADVVTWVKATLLTPFRAGLDDDLWGRFLDDYERRIVALLGPARPYFYTFKRVLVRARFP